MIIQDQEHLEESIVGQDHVTIIGDVRSVLKKLPSDYVQCVVTSPPYW